MDVKAIKTNKAWLIQCQQIKKDTMHELACSIATTITCINQTAVGIHYDDDFMMICTVWT